MLSVLNGLVTVCSVTILHHLLAKQLNITI